MVKAAAAADFRGRPDAGAPTVVVCHNFYQRPGGEDEVFRAETRLLSSRGHQVVTYTAENETIRGASRLEVAGRTLWNRTVYRELRGLFRRYRPEVAHFHNTFPLISPAAYYAARAEGVPVVQTLHNFRLGCPNALLFRRGRVCESCLGRAVPWPGVVYACYRDSRAATAVTAGMLGVHRALGTWSRCVDRYVALTSFARERFIAAGLPAHRIVVKPNFMFPDPGVGQHRGGYGLFVGRLSPEKGLETLLQAWERIGDRFTLKIVGDGPLAGLLEEPSSGVEWLRWRSRDEVLALMKEAAFLVLPSEWYENFPMTLVEAFATGLPVIGSRLGSLAELIRDGETGRCFQPGNSADLAASLEWAIAHPMRLEVQGRVAREEFETRYTADRNYEMLTRIYASARERARPRA